MVERLIRVLVCLLALSAPIVLHAQPGCTVPTLTEADPGITPWSPLPTAVAINTEGTNVPMEDILGAVGDWTDSCRSTTEIPLEAVDGISFADSFRFGEAWTVKEGKFDDFERPPGLDRDRCAEASPRTHEIRIFTDAPRNCSLRTTRSTIAHELGHVLRLANTDDPACTSPTVGPPSIMSSAINGAVTTETCNDAKREVDREPDPEPSPCVANPGPDCPGYCEAFPDDPDCFCVLNPFHELCGGEIEICCPPYDIVLVPQCRNFPYARQSGSGSVSVTNISSNYGYRVSLSRRAEVRIALSAMSRDFSCSVTEGGGPGREGPTGASGATACASDDTWTGILDAGDHTVTVWPTETGSGDHTLTVAATNLRTEMTTTAVLVRVSEIGITAEQEYQFYLNAEASVSVQLTGLTRDFDCSINDAYSCSNNLGRLDDSWTGILPAGIHTAKVKPIVADESAATSSGSNQGGSEPGNYTLTVTAEPVRYPPAAPVLTGSATPASQRLRWSAPPSDSPITLFEMMLRESSLHQWRHTTAGSPAPSSAFPASAREWNLTNSPGLYREYRLRASSAVGYGDWSNVVALYSVPPPPPPPPPTSPPSAPSISGVAGVRSHSVSWSAPDSKRPIWSYQMEVRESSFHSWRWTSAGLPSGSSSFPAATRSWVLTNAPEGLYRQYRVRAVSSAGNGAWSHVVSLRALGTPQPDPEPEPDPPSPPGAPRLSGSLLGKQTHTLSWSAASSTIPITRYQMQTRNSFRHGWRYTTAGTPSPSSRFGPTVRNWQVTTPLGLHRQYRVRARNDSGYGAWSSVVSLTSQGGGVSGAGDDDDSTDDDGDGIDDGYECADDDEDC